MTPAEIAQALEIDDLCKQVAGLRRANALAAVLLEDVAHMIDHGSLDTAKEYIDRAQVALKEK